MNELIILCLQLLAGAAAILTGLLSLLIGSHRYKQKRYNFAKLYFSFGYFAFAWFILKWTIQIDPNLPFIQIVAGEVVRVIAPSVYAIFLLDMYIESREKITHSANYHGIERRHNT